MTGVLVRRFLRRDRWMFVWWGLGAALLYYSQAVSVKGLYATQAEFDRAARTMESNAAFIAMAGPARALNTVGGQVTWQATAFGALVAGLMSMFLVGRHTRAEEESGRDELLRAAAVERHAPMTAGVVVALLANVLLGLLVALSLISFPLAVADSVALGVGLTLCGWVFTGVALLAAQLTSSTRATYGLTGAVLGLAYVLRAVGDVGYPALTWLSPIGWYQAMHAFSGVRWWPALLLLATAAATLGGAYAVFGRRDFGDGVFPSRPGPARAPAGLRSGLGLAWRLHRGALLGWSLGLFFVGLAYGSLGSQVGDLVGDSETTRDVIAQGGTDLVDGFYATALLTLALLASGYAISAALRPRAEEEAGRVEALLATGLSRSAWQLGHLAIVVAGTLVVLLSGGLGLGVGYAGATGDRRGHRVVRRRDAAVRRPGAAARRRGGAPARTRPALGVTGLDRPRGGRRGRVLRPVAAAAAGAPGPVAVRAPRAGARRAVRAGRLRRRAGRGPRRRGRGARRARAARPALTPDRPAGRMPPAGHGSPPRIWRTEGGA